jgi:replicative DNA helicase
VGIDNLLKGGLGIGELGVVLAPTGTGKTTLLTKFANTAYNLGYNVVQIFFEDNPGNIKRKHYTIWTEIAPDSQPEFKEEVKAKVEEAQAKSKGSLKLLKLASDNVTVSEIKNKIRKMNSEGGKKVDLLVLDYVDCVSTDKSTNGEEWKGEGSVMRSLESMTSEFEMAIWTATQGNRESISSEVVTGDQMGGSIKKAQIAHVILSIGKTLEQKEHNLATLTLLKSRIGRDGVVFQNCKFNNEFLLIDTESQNTLLGHEEQKVQINANRAAEAFKRRQQVASK